MLNEIGTVDNIPEFIEGVKNRLVFLLDLVAEICKLLNLMIMVFNFYTGNEKCQVLGIVCTKTMIPEQKLLKNWQKRFFRL